MIEVVIIGSGNVGKHLFDALKTSKSVSIAQIVGRNIDTLNYFGGSVDTTTDFSEIKEADIYIIAVNDDSIASVSELVRNKSGVIAHTSGSMSIDVLSNHNRFGVFYPLQTLSRAHEVDFKSIPICVEAHNDNDLRLLMKLAGKVSDSVYEVDSNQRKKLHLAAVFVNNFTNHLYQIGSHICQENGLSFEMLHPLLLETAKKVKTLSPYDAQTGPARRNDTATIESHLEQLTNSDYKEIYAVLTKSIQQVYGKKL
ncbi:MAG: DUF2520 domain-containing protein [Pricia sp.]|nr:DUF2520 domain-containing protein [Pricia sp.]